MTIRVALLCTLALLVAPAAAGAKTPSSAQRFSDAALRLKLAVKALEPAFATAYDEVDMPACERALERRPPKARVPQVVSVFVVALTQPFVEVSIPPLKQMVRDLEAIPTRDPALQAGRVAWRESVEFFEAFPRLAEPCHALERWSRAGWPAAGAPKVSMWTMQRLEERADVLDAKFRRAAKRLRVLGISPFSAERFRGETIFDDVLPDAESSVGTESGEKPEL